MNQGIKTARLRIGGMTCVSCQNKIERKLRGTAGVQKAEVSYSAGTAFVTYDADAVSLKDIIARIEKLDYTVLTGKQRPESSAVRVAGLMIVIVALYMLLQQFGILNLLVPSRLAEANMGYGMLFVIGLITSVHCVAMCGGINLSQCIPQGEDRGGEGRFSTLRPTLMYNLGRVISYTVVGFIVGALGSAITFSNTLQGVLKLVAGVFMVIMGLNMLGIFPWLRRLNPRMPKFIATRIGLEKARSSSPLIVGLLNGLMPCGPLQAMQIYALSTGNPFAGRAVDVPVQPGDRPADVRAWRDQFGSRQKIHAKGHDRRRGAGGGAGSFHVHPGMDTFRGHHAGSAPGRRGQRGNRRASRKRWEGGGRCPGGQLHAGVRKVSIDHRQGGNTREVDHRRPGRQRQRMQRQNAHQRVRH